MKKITRKGYTFFIETYYEDKVKIAEFYLEKDGVQYHTNFFIENDIRYIKLFDDRKDYHEYITYAQKKNKYRMIDNIIERLEKEGI